jgi:hypothetical protein
MARCPNCDAEIPIGCNCEVGDENCFEWTGDGSEGSPYVLLPVISADPDQLLSCGADGLLAETPDVLLIPPAVQAYNTNHLTIANNTLTTVTLNTENYDTDTMHSTSSNTGRLTFNQPGTYIVTFVCAWNKHVTGDRIAQIRKNGVDILAYESKRSSANSADLIVGHCITVEDDFIATDYVEARVQHTSGGNLLLLSESYSPFFSAVRVA